MHFSLAFAVLIYLLFWKGYQAERAALLGAGVLVISAWLFGYQACACASANFWVFANAGHAVVEILLISAASGVVIGVLNVTGLSFNLTYLLVQIGGGNVLRCLACLLLFASFWAWVCQRWGFMCCWLRWSPRP